MNILKQATCVLSVLGFLTASAGYVSATEAKAGTNEKQAIGEPASAGNVASEQTKTEKSADKAKGPLAADQGAVSGTSTSKK